MSENAVLLDLATPRTILLHAGKHVFTIHCRPVLKADYLKYFSSIRITSEQSGKERVNTMDFDTPRVELAESVIESVEGYKVAGGGKLEDLPNWRSRIPLAHRLEVGSALTSVEVSKADDEYLIHPEGEEVSLDATWSLDGKVVKFSGLKHLLKTPTAAQHQRFNREASRSLVVGGSRKGRTIYTGAQQVLCELYDELILSVDGYAWKGYPLADRATIVDVMDLHHKFTAAQELFKPMLAVSTEADSD